MEDIVADDLAVIAEEVIRTDTVTGAQTKLMHLPGADPPAMLTGGRGALAGWTRRRSILRSTAKSGRAALVVQGLTTTDDDDRLVPAVRSDPPGEAQRRVAEGL